MKQREKIIPAAFGEVLEIGIGSGLNLPFYNDKEVKHVTGIDPSKEIWEQNDLEAESLPFEFEFVSAPAEKIPHENDSFDSVVVTYTLCSIPELYSAFDEIRRVIKSNGKLIFCEHGKAPDKSVQRWQNFVNPVWKRIGGGCHLNRDIPLLIRGNGFKIEHLDTMYIPGWKPASFNFWGTATL